MTAKEKADEIFDKMCQTISGNCEHDSYCTEFDCQWKGTVLCKVAQNEAKQCALILIDEILEIDFIIPEHGNTNLTYNYWLSVKEEITKL
jgi:hypothetical protein